MLIQVKNKKTGEVKTIHKEDFDIYRKNFDVFEPAETEAEEAKAEKAAVSEAETETGEVTNEEPARHRRGRRTR